MKTAFSFILTKDAKTKVLNIYDKDNENPLKLFFQQRWSHLKLGRNLRCQLIPIKPLLRIFYTEMNRNDVKILQK